MRMVPESSSLVRDREIIEEGGIGSYGTLGHTDGTVGVARPLLEESVPVLSTTNVSTWMNLWQYEIYDARA